MKRTNAVAKVGAAQAAVVEQKPIRALQLFERLPAGHMTFLVTEGGAEPHLRVGEYAVIDCTDRNPQHGELYLIQSNYGERRRYLQQASRCFMVISSSGLPEKVWWLRDMRGWRQTDVMADGVPIFSGLSDGPMKKKGLRKKIAGRVVGYAMWCLGDELEACAGFED